MHDRIVNVGDLSRRVIALIASPDQHPLPPDVEHSPGSARHPEQAQIVSTRTSGIFLKSLSNVANRNVAGGCVGSDQAIDKVQLAVAVTFQCILMNGKFRQFHAGTGDQVA